MTWRGHAKRLFQNNLQRSPDYRHLRRADRLKWFEAGKILEVEAGQNAELGDAKHIFVVDGSAELNGSPLKVGELISFGQGANLRAQTECRLALLPAAASAIGVAPRA